MISMKVRLILFDSYIATIKNSLGTKMFQTLFADIDGEETNILKNGRLSCAVFVSSVLLMFGLIKERHSVTPSTVRDMQNWGWYEINTPKLGCVVRWEGAKQVDTLTEHIGFYTGDYEAISTDWETGVPHKHHWTYGENDGKPVRAIIGLYWHPKLDQKYFNNNE